MGIPQRLLGDDEEIVVSVRPHGRVLIGPVLVLFVVAPITGVVAGFVGGGTVGSVLRLVVLALGALVVVRGSLVPFLVWRSTTYTVTTQRVALRRGIVHRFGRDVPLTKVNGVTFVSSAWDRAFGSGRIRVDAAGEGPLVLDDVPAVEHVQRAVQKYAGIAAAALEDDDGADGPTGPPTPRDGLRPGPAPSVHSVSPAAAPPAPASGDQPTIVLRGGPGPSGTALDVRDMFSRDDGPPAFDDLLASDDAEDLEDGAPAADDEWDDGSDDEDDDEDDDGFDDLDEDDGLDEDDEPSGDDDEDLDDEAADLDDDEEDFDEDDDDLDDADDADDAGAGPAARGADEGDDVTWRRRGRSGGWWRR